MKSLKDILVEKAPSDELAIHKMKQGVRKFLEDSYKDGGFFTISEELNADGKFVVTAPWPGEEIFAYSLDAKSLTNGDFVFAPCKTFRISCASTLVDLKGIPEGCESVHIWHCFKLKNLVGLPKKLKGDLKLEALKITSLEGCPESIDGNFTMNTLPNLENFKGGPKYMWGNLKCENMDSLVDCSGSFIKILDGVTLKNCPKLKSVKGLPKLLGGDLRILECPSLTSLKGAPTAICGHLKLQDCMKLKSIDPVKRVDGILSFYGTNIHIKDWAELKELGISVGQPPCFR
ncbi:MAG: hypothetical protein IKT74_03675 [Bacteroidales bacterium]|nr:hypothetical protein [Bacteroidales bacterium]